MPTTTPMLRKLEHKFVLIDMLLVALVLVVVFATVAVMNFSQREHEVTEALKASSQFDGGSAPLPAGDRTGMTVGAPTGASTQDATGATDQGAQPSSTQGAGTSDASAQGASAGNTTGQDGGDSENRHGNRLVSMSIYVVDDSYGVTQTVIDSLSLSSDTLSSALAEVQASTADSGRLSDLGLYYQRSVTSQGTKVSFASTEYVDSTTLSLVGTLLIVGICALVAFLFISIFLARWALRPVKEAWAQQQQFVADASHELKTPLTVLLANNSILMEHPERTVGSQMQWVESSDTEAHLMQNLVNDLLFLAKPDDQQQHVVYTTVDLSSLVESDVLQFESVAYEKGLQLEADVDGGITTWGSETRIQRLVGTLVDNACKYASDGSTVTARLRREGHGAVFSVNNHGEVITKEDQAHIFDRFWRADRARVRAQGGYGLGLAIAKEIADEHGAQIAVASDAEQGTTFTVTFRECS